MPFDLYSKTRVVRLGRNPGQLDQSLALDADSTDPAHVVISDALATGMGPVNLRVVRGSAVRLDRSSVLLADGRSFPADVIVWGTGYRPELSFLSSQVRQRVEYDPADLLQPLILVDSVFPAGVEGLSFVGMYRGPYVSGIELQARWACAVIAGALPRPEPMEVARGIRAARRIRSQRPRPQFPHDDLELADQIGRRLGLLPGDEVGSGAGGWFWDSPVVPAHYRMLGPHSCPEFARMQITDAASRCVS
jgi:dimethylaniline monooxygenase (N-oxide forming)